ncbi:MAG: glycoside hydrolase family 3 protein [Pseudomonadales bacterium]|nr:glycoside hydrolase family 3 protein [Pseudomonadales bacterium]
MKYIDLDGLRFRDLDHDGVLAPYEDWRLPPEVRVADLLGRMTLDEKVGVLLHGTLPAAGTGAAAALGVGREYDLQMTREMILGRGINSLITRLATSPQAFASQNNAVQALAAEGRLGIPVTISTDPRHQLNHLHGASVEGAGFSQWPGTLGLAATFDEDLVRRFGDVVRQEYRATGVHMALSPQADLATSPRWARIDGTFGDDPALVRRLTGAYVAGIQGGDEGVTSTGVAAVVKHWVGYGASEDGFDGHNYYGRFSVFPGGALAAHIEAFLDAFDRKVAGIMPTYNILKNLALNGELIEQVGAGYSRELLTDLLRGEYQYEGLVLSDWAIARDVNESCRTGQPRMQPADISMAWGVEELSLAERFAKGLNAGLDQFGGEDSPAPVLAALDQGLLSAARIDECVSRVLLHKFQLGLFENPLVDEEVAGELVGNGGFRAEAMQAQQRSVVLLKQGSGSAASVGSRLLPNGAKVFLYDLAAPAFASAGYEPVVDANDAEVAVLRLRTPSQVLHPGFFFGSFQKEGDLDFRADDEGIQLLTSLTGRMPVIVVAEMDRPAVLGEVTEQADWIFVTFGICDEALISVLENTALSQGRLPYALPDSMAAVLAKAPDSPDWPETPRFQTGYRAEA